MKFYCRGELFIANFALLTGSLLKTIICEPEPLDLIEQHGEQNHHGHGDVVELWEENQDNIKMRNSLRSNAKNRWTIYRDIADAKFVIPYNITGNFTSEERTLIIGAMERIERNTCVKFRERKGERDFVDIQNEYGEGCFTNVGRISGRNVLMLESTEEETCATNATIIHELLHKIGLWHEQMRQDRDDYIEVNLENIPFYLRAQFRKVPGSVATTHNVRYDYLSVMHYGENAFADPADAITMKTKNPRFQDKIGHAADASRGDYIKVCAMYGCPVCMGEEFDLEKAAQDYGKSQENTIDDNIDSEKADDDGCVPLSICGTAITMHLNPTLYKIACCEPCNQCQPEPHCSLPHAKDFPHLYKYDCCGRCEKKLSKTTK